jgi:hypothetical protein
MWGFVRGSGFLSVVPRPSTWASPINPSFISSIWAARSDHSLPVHFGSELTTAEKMNKRSVTMKPASIDCARPGTWEPWGATAW